MRKTSLIAIIVISGILLVFACQKITINTSKQTSKTNVSNIVINNTYIDSFSSVNHNGDTNEVMTVLGIQLTNPYLIPNMTQAYHNLGIYNVPVNVTNLYVRFKPTITQFKYLDSFMDVQGFDLFDIPLDYQILTEGDYYQDPSIPAEQPTWQYAVVPANFSFPAGIQYESLAQIHIPADNYTAVETEAEAIAGGGGGGLSSIGNGGVQTNGIDCLAGYHKDPETGQCVPDNCPTGYHWVDGNGCVPDNSCPSGYYWNGTACVPDVTTPPPPAPDAAVPAGAITVDETQPLPGLALSTTIANGVLPFSASAKSTGCGPQVV